MLSFHFSIFCADFSGYMNLTRILGGIACCRQQGLGSARGFDARRYGDAVRA